MPTYQYRCEKCGKTFESVEHLAEHASAHPPCPHCGKRPGSTRTDAICREDVKKELIQAVDAIFPFARR